AGLPAARGPPGARGGAGSRALAVVRCARAYGHDLRPVRTRGPPRGGEGNGALSVPLAAREYLRTRAYSLRRGSLRRRDVPAGKGWTDGRGPDRGPAAVRFARFGGS